MDVGWRILNEKMIQPAKARTDQARDEMSKNRFLQDSFRLATQIYRCRGYAGTIFVSGQFGVYTESVSITIALANAAPPVKGAEQDALNVKLETDDSKGVMLIRTLVRRLEARSEQWLDHDELDPEMGSQGTIGFNLPIVDIGWNVVVKLTVYQSTLRRYMAFSSKLPAPSLPPAPPAQSESATGAVEGADRGFADV